MTYGDKALSILHLGSGGGGWRSHYGSRGGGALQIECVNFENDGNIKVNGDSPIAYGGAGSGGSILIICQYFQLNINDKKSCYIHVKGGYIRQSRKGGDGRIRIKTEANVNKYVDQIEPVPYIG